MSAHRIILVPLAALLAFGAAAFGSGAVVSQDTVDKTISITVGSVVEKLPGR